MDDVNTPYWSTQVFGTGFSLTFNRSGYIFIHADNGSIISTISSNSLASTQDFYQRAVLDYDGVFKHYIYPKNYSSITRNWSTLSVMPQNICLHVLDESGSGACGFNSYCTFDGTSKTCHCPYGYSFIDPRDVMRGCKQDFDSQSCDQTSLETDHFYLNEMLHMDWPLSDYDHFRLVSEDFCKQACLEDCFCALVIFKDGECWKKKQPLSNGRKDLSFGGKALIKIRMDNATSSHDDDDDIDPKNNDQSTLFIIGSTILSISVFLNLLLLLGACFVAYRFSHNSSEFHENIPFISNMNLRSFTYEESMEGTTGFTEELKN